MDVQGFWRALDDQFTDRLGLPSGGTIYLPEGGEGLSELCSRFFSDEESAELAELGSAYEVAQDIGELRCRRLIGFEWTYEGPPSWDTWIELLEISPSRTYVALPPDEANGQEWSAIAAVELPASPSTFEWLLGEIWGAQDNVRGAELDQTAEDGALKSLPTLTTIMAPDLLSIASVRRAINQWLGEDPTSEKWGELLERIGDAIRYRGPKGRTRRMQEALDAWEQDRQLFRSQDLRSIVNNMESKRAAEVAEGQSLRAKLLHASASRGQLLDMYMELCCGVASPSAS